MNLRTAGRLRRLRSFSVLHGFSDRTPEGLEGNHLAHPFVYTELSGRTDTVYTSLSYRIGADRERREELRAKDAERAPFPTCVGRTDVLGVRTQNGEQKFGQNEL